MANIKLIFKEKYQGDGRAFGDSSSIIYKLVVLLTADGSKPSTYEDVQGLDECKFAPGSLLFDSANNKSFIYDGTAWKEWG